MIFHEIEIENFRQFYAKQTLPFSHDEEKNVTIIHGENGAGKTAILNAFSWCFYDKVDFENSDKIVNERLIDEAKIGDELIVRVRVAFEDDGNRYIFIRTRVEEKIDEKNTRTKRDDQIECIEIGEDGISREKHNPEDLVEQILPKRMYPYFFFNGERIDRLSKNESSREIIKAIKNIMGLEIIERAISHLSGRAKKSLKQDLQKYGNIEVQEKLGKLDDLEGAKKNIVSQIQQVKKNKKGFNQEKEDVLNQLRKLKEAKEYQERRDQLTAQRKSVEEEIKNINKELKKCISKWGFTAFTEKLIDKCDTIIQEKRRKGEIPAGIKKQFVEDLINQGVCICNTKLEKSSEALRNVQVWLDKSGSEEVEESFIEMAGAIRLTRTKQGETFTEINRLVAKREQLQANKKQIGEELSEISRKLSNKMSEEVTDLEEKNKNLAKKISDCDYQFGAKDQEIKDVEEKIEKFEKEIRDMKKEERAFQVASRRLEVCDELINLFKNTMEFISKRIKDKVSNKVDEIFRNIIKKDYWAEITDDYELRIYKKVGESKIPVGKSTGENQVSSLSFIGGLADIARKQYENKNTAFFFKGGIYPLIMDSPFGQLDPEYRGLVAQSIPKLTPQIIVLVSESQWKGEVEAGMSPYIGKESCLFIYTPNPALKRIENQGFLRKSEKYEYSEITEISNDGC